MNRLSLLLLGAVVISSCARVPFADDRTFVPPGFLCTTSPSTAYGPGYIFRIDESGSAFLVTDARDRAVVSNYQAALGTYKASLATGGGLSFALSSIGAPKSGEAGASSTQSTTMAFRDGRFAFMGDADESQFIQETRGQISVRPGSRYFFVRDAVQARGIEIRISSEDEEKLGGEAAIENLISLKPNFSAEREENLEVVGEFETPLNVCVRAVEIGAATVAGELAPATEGPGAANRRYLEPSDLQKALESL